MRVAVLIDGFNLYHHMDNRRYAKYKWLNFSRFFRHYVNSRDITEIHYFTTVNYEDHFAFRKNEEKYKGKLKRHLTLIKAEEAYGVFVHYGAFRNREFQCPHCKKTFLLQKEKQTDVGLGAYLAYLAFSRGIEKFIILSADTDLISAINLVKENSETKQIQIMLPPGVEESELSKHCDHNHIITESILRDSLFPRIVENKKTGEIIVCPKEWDKLDWRETR